jgi:outer membrane beta-barrel protein
VKTLLAIVFSAWSLAAASAAHAADPLPAPVLSQDADDELDDLLGPGPDGPSDSTVAEEKKGLATATETEEVALPPSKRKVIKVLQPKQFLKIGRFEAMPMVGIVTNDPFIRRILFGAAFAYHPTEVLGIEVQGAYAPNFGRGDWKNVTKQIFDSNELSPQISRMIATGTVNFTFSPLYGKVATLGRNTIIFDIYGVLGAGFVFTQDDLELLEGVGDPKAEATANQVHPAITFGGGLRVALSKLFALRLEARSISYIGVIDSVNLELKNNLTIQIGGSFFFGRRIE